MKKLVKLSSLKYGHRFRFPISEFRKKKCIYSFNSKNGKFYYFEGLNDTYRTSTNKLVILV